MVSEGEIESGVVGRPKPPSHTGERCAQTRRTCNIWGSCEPYGPSGCICSKWCLTLPEGSPVRCDHWRHKHSSVSHSLVLRPSDIRGRCARSCRTHSTWHSCSRFYSRYTGARYGRSYCTHSRCALARGSHVLCGPSWSSCSRRAHQRSVRSLWRYVQLHHSGSSDPPPPYSRGQSALDGCTYSTSPWVLHGPLVLGHFPWDIPAQNAPCGCIYNTLSLT